MKAGHTIFLAGLLVLFTVPAFAQTTWIVDQGGGGDYTTIQDCIDGSVDGDTCLVNAGTYPENIDFLNKEITVESASGPGSTIIDGSAAGPVVTILCDDYKEFHLNGFTVRNGLTAGGGGISCSGIGIFQVYVHNCIIEDNEAGTGGAIYCATTLPAGNQIQLYLSSSTVRNNTATVNGGGIALTGLDVAAHISYCTIEGNTALDEGGGVYSLFSIFSGSVIYSSTISGNSAANGAGVLGDVNITNSTVSGNHATFMGGGLSGSYVEAVNCMVVDNTAEYYAGGIAGEELYITGSTVAGNSAGDTGGGVVLVAGGSPRVTNTIVWGNTALSDPNIYDTSGSIDVSYSDVEGGWPGTGNIDLDPLFADPSSGDYHLADGSPCTDVGNNASATGLDIDGDSRTVDGDCDLAAVVDMGADEFIPPATEGAPGDPACTDGRDNDCDGLIDSADSDCVADYPPSSHAAVYGAESVVGSGMLNQIVLILAPIGAFFFLRGLRKKK